MFSQLIRGTAPAVILSLDYWAPMWQGGDCGCFPLFVAEGHEHFLCFRSGCWLCGFRLWLCTRIFYSSHLLPATYLLCSFFSCESIVATESVGAALRTSLGSLRGTGLLCLGNVGNLKRAAGVQARICPSLSATHGNRCEQCVSVWCLGTSFLHLPGEAERTTPALFSPGKSENYAPLHCASQSGFISAWLKWAYHNAGGEGESKLLCFQRRAAVLWSRRPCPEPQSGFPSAAGADRDFWQGRGPLPLFLTGLFVPRVRSRRHQ